MHSIQIENTLYRLRLLRSNENWQELASCAQDWLQNHAPVGVVVAELAFAGIRLGLPDQAERLAEQALKLDAVCVLAVRVLVLVRLEQQRFDEALALATQIFSSPFVLSCPEEAAQARLTLASVHNTMNAPDKALALIDESLTIFPIATAHALRATILFKQGLFAETLESAKACLAIAPGKVAFWKLLATAAHQLNRLDEMFAAYEQVLQIDPKDVPTLSTLGELYTRIHRYDRAEELLQRAVAADPAYVPAWTNLGRLFHTLERAEECKHAFETALNLNPNQPEVLGNLGALNLKVNRIDEAETLLQHAYGLAPQIDSIVMNLSACYLLKEQTEKAEALLAEVIARNPDAPSVVRMQAGIVYSRGDYHEGLRLTQQALANELWFLKQQSRLSLFGDGAHPPMDVYDASETLIAVCQFLERLQVPYFLSVGTLLGIIRDGELLPHDKDADLGIGWDVDREWLLTQFEKSEEFAINGPRPEPERADWNFSVIRKTNLIAVDFFFHKPDGDDWLMGLNANPAPWLIRFKQRKLTTVEYKGHLLPIPENPEGYLEEVYGPDWRIPMPSYDTVIAASNLCPEAYLSTKIIGYNRLYEALMNRTWKKVLWYCEALKRFDNPPILDELAGWLRDAMPQKLDKVL